MLAPPNGSRASAGVTTDGTLDIRRVGFAGSWDAGAGPARPLRAERRAEDRPRRALHRCVRPGHAAHRGERRGDPLPVPRRDPVGRPVGAGRRGALGLEPGRRSPPAARCSSRATLRRRSSARRPSSACRSRSASRSSPTGPASSRRSVAARRSCGTARPVFRAGEAFTTNQLGQRAPRSAVGQAADGRIVLVAVDGRQPGLQRRADQLRARPGARPARGGHRHGARQRRLDDDGLRRDAPQPPVGRAGAAHLERADVRVPGRLRVRAAPARLAERRRRRRRARPPVPRLSPLDRERGPERRRAPPRPRPRPPRSSRAPTPCRSPARPPPRRAPTPRPRSASGRSR